MAFGLYSLLEACLLVVNAMAVLNEERFLSKSMFVYSLLFIKEESKIRFVKKNENRQKTSI